MANRVVHCQLCGRRILPGQSTCKCGSIVPDAPLAESESSGWRDFDWGLVLPWVPVVGVVILLFWFFRPPFSLYYSLIPALKVYGVIVILSSAAALVAADRMQKRGIVPAGESPLSQLPPQGWFPLLLVAWPVAFPAFLQIHYDNVEPVRVKRGYISTGVFLLLLLVVPLMTKRSTPKWTGGTAPVVADEPAAPQPGPAPRADGGVVSQAPVPASPDVTPAAAAPTQPPVAGTQVAGQIQPAPQAQPQQQPRPAAQPQSGPSSGGQNQQSRSSFGVSGMPKVN